MTERELQRAIIDLARRLGWRIAHFETSRSIKDGAFMTAQTGHRGFPDLILLRPPRLVVAELKGKKGIVDFDQATWLNGFALVPGCEQYLWRPADWELGKVEDVLR